MAGNWRALTAAAALASAPWGCAHGVDDASQNDGLSSSGGSAGSGGAPTAGTAGDSTGVSGGGTAGDDTVGDAAAGTGGAGGGAGGSSAVGDSAAGSGAVDVSAGGSGGTPDAGSVPKDASSVDASDAGITPPRDAAPEAAPPCPGGGYAVSFSGTAQITIPGSALPIGNSVRTVEMWVYTRATSWMQNKHTVFEYGTNQRKEAFAIDMDAFPNMEFYIWLDPSLYFDTGLQQTGWAHLAVSYDGTKLHAFVNGVEKGSNTPPTGLATAATALTLGSSVASNTHFDGVIDEVRVWSVARAASDIQKTMSVRLRGDEANLVGYWTFDEGAGTTAGDSSGKGNNGTLQNNVIWVTSGVPLTCP